MFEANKQEIKLESHPAIRGLGSHISPPAAQSRISILPSGLGLLIPTLNRYLLCMALNMEFLSYIVWILSVSDRKADVVDVAYVNM